MYQRLLKSQVISGLERSMIVIIYGTRQVGKTTLTSEIVQYYKQNGYAESDILQITGDDLEIREAMSSQKLRILKSVLGSAKLLIFDEAQRVENIGLNLKLIYDQIPGIKILATGSSSFDLANKISEPLTGRNLKLMLTPLSFQELSQKESIFQLKAGIENILLYGSYPKIYTQTNLANKVLDLQNLSSDYLYKDILEWENIQKSDKLNKILEYLALQIGGVVSFNDIANKLELNSRTVEKYVDLLEKAFVIFKLRAYSKNQGNELNRSFKIYFWDLGIRNSLIQNFNKINLRQDLGNLWENFCVAERIKKNYNDQIIANYYFWRNYQQHEVDFIEEQDGKLAGFEFKFSKNKIQKGSYNFTTNYPNSTLKLINLDNIEEFLIS